MIYVYRINENIRKRCSNCNLSTFSARILPDSRALMAHCLGRFEPKSGRTPAVGIIIRFDDVFLRINKCYVGFSGSVFLQQFPVISMDINGYKWISGISLKEKTWSLWRFSKFLWSWSKNCGITIVHIVHPLCTEEFPPRHALWCQPLILHKVAP